MDTAPSQVNLYFPTQCYENLSMLFRNVSDLVFPFSPSPLFVQNQSEQKWKQLAELAISKCQFGLAQECLHHAQDYGGLLLLATASGNASMVNKLAEGAEKDGKNNVAFMSYFLQGK